MTRVDKHEGNLTLYYFNLRNPASSVATPRFLNEVCSWLLTKSLSSHTVTPRSILINAFVSRPR